MIWEQLITVVLIISYGLLPIIMSLLGVWNLKCLSQHVAVLTGVIIFDSLYDKLSREFEESMETDYDISSSEVESDIK